MAEMNEDGALSLPPSPDPLEPPPERDPGLHGTPPGDRRSVAATVVSLLCLLALALGGFWIWRDTHNQTRDLTGRLQRIEQAQRATDPAKLSQLDEQVAALRATVTKLEARPQPVPPPPVDLKPIEDRVAALEKRPAPAAPDESALTTKVRGLVTQLGGLAQQVQATQDSATSSRQDQAKAASALTGKVQGLLTQVNELAQQAQAAQEAAKTAQDQAKAAREQANAAQQQAKTAESQAGAAQGQASSAQAQTSAATDRVGQSQRLQVATAALDEGKPLGDIPGAPQALSRFATTPPPTEASLRLSFPAAAKRAAEASRPSLAGESLAKRMWTRVQSLVTVKQGDRVLVGAPASATLAQAQARLDAGDLPGTLGALQALDPAAAAAMAPWREQAQALVDARSALAAAAAKLAHS